MKKNSKISGMHILQMVMLYGHRSTFLHLDTFVEKEMTEKEKSPMQSLATAHKGLI